jgi:lantibiotic modifying enzyme
MFGGRVYLGLAHGIAGVALFFALLHEATHDTAWKSAALEIFETLEAQSRSTHGGWNWPSVMGEDSCSRCQWSHGAPGIGMSFLKAYEIFQQPRLLHAAQMAGEATYAYGDFRQNATQCIGLAGCGDLLLELGRVTGEPVWFARAAEFGTKALAYRATSLEGDAWPTDGVGLYSPDFMYGGAGIGHFLLRLETHGAVPLPLIAP